MRRPSILAALVAALCSGAAHADGLTPSQLQALYAPGWAAPLAAPGGDISTSSLIATGSTTRRTLAARAADVLSVLDFGAKCDGVTDDSAALQATFNAAMASTRPVEIRLPPALCLSSAPLTLTVGQGQGIGIHGTRFASKLQFTAGSDGLAVTMSPISTSVGQFSQGSFSASGITFLTQNNAVGNSALTITQGAAGTGTMVTSLIPKVQLSDLLFSAFSGGAGQSSPGAWLYGVKAIGLRNVTVRDSSFIGGRNDITSTFVYLDASSTTASVNHVLSGLRMAYGGNGIVIGNTGQTVPIQGIAIDDYVSLGNNWDVVASATGGSAGDGLQIANSNFGGQAGSISVTGYNTTEISNSYFVFQDTPYILISGGKRVIIHGNTFLGGGTTTAIQLASVSAAGDAGSVISGNLFSNYGLAPVVLTGTTNNTVISGNNMASPHPLVNDTTGLASNFVGFNLDNSIYQSRAPVVGPSILAAGTANSAKLLGSVTGSPVVVTGVGGDTNLGVAVVPLGNGAISAAVPDSTATGGNARGTYSTDWQHSRTSSAQVASGDHSVIIGGGSSAATGSYSIAGGNSSTSGGNNSVAIGFANTANGAYSSARGGRANDRSRTAVDCFSGMQFSTAGDGQTCQTVLYNSTATAATAVRATSDGNAPASSNTMTIPAGLHYHLAISGACQDNTATGTAAWAAWDVVYGDLDRKASVTYAGGYNAATAPTRSAGALSTMTMQLGSDTTNNGLAVYFTTPTGNTDTLHCVAHVTSLEEIL